MPITGLDASRHQGLIHWPSVAGAGHTFAFLKATDGIRYAYVNWFHQNRRHAYASGLTVGAYHFLLDHYHGADQARFYVQEVNRSGGFNGIVPILDVEREADGTTPGIRQVREFVDEFRRLVPGRQILIYTGRWYWVGVIGNPHGADLGPLWHSEYDGISPIDADVRNGPELDRYGGWSDCLVWQHTSSGLCPGVSTRCDLNIFYGSRAQLDALAYGQTAVPPAAPGKDPKVYLLVQGHVDAAEGGNGKQYLTDMDWKRHLRSDGERDWFINTIEANGGSVATEANGAPFIWDQDDVNQLRDIGSNQVEGTFAWWAADYELNGNESVGHTVVRQVLEKLTAPPES